MTNQIEYPEMRLEIIAALKSLSNPAHQRTRWGQVEEGTDYYDDLGLNVHILYDDCEVLPSPDLAVGSLLLPPEVPAFLALHHALDPMITEHGDRPDSHYLADPRWPDVVSAATVALRAMRESEAASE
jgi:hypothetical protein